MPFLDVQYVREELSYPLSMKFKGRFLKLRLRNLASKYLPDNIVWRLNKFGFEAPSVPLIEKYQKQMFDSIKIASECLVDEQFKSLLIDDTPSSKVTNSSENMLLWRKFVLSKWLICFFTPC